MHLLVVHQVTLVQEDNDCLDTDLTAKQDVLTSLWHCTVGGGDDKDTSIHTGSAGDHVLDVVSVTWAIDVSIVAIIGLVLDRRRVDGDASGLLLRALIDVLVVFEGRGSALRQMLRNRGGKRCLTVIDVTCTQQ